MTPEEPKNRKRRRRRRRPNGNAATTPNPQSGNGSDQPPAPERTAQSAANPQNRTRRRRSRHRRRGEGEPRFDSPRPVSDDQPALPETVTEVGGVLFIKPNGTGTLVNPANNYMAQSTNPIVPRNIIERYHLQPGLKMSGPARRAGNSIELVNPEIVEDLPLEVFRESRRPFSELISIDPVRQFKLETEPDRLSTRVLDLLAPIGRGQRCLVVAPPKAGKTTLLKDIAHGIERNHPEVIVMVLLVDERPEEVTDIRRSVRGEVIASSSDETAENHITLAELVLERARRLVELKHDVIILCDSITRMSRAYNNEQRSSGRILTGGIDARTMEKPRRFFGSARCGEDWGSLTIVATALIDTGSRMDEVIFQEFKGTGNTEIVLDRGLFERRIFPAINIAQTGTRKEEKLLPAEWQPKIHTLRRALAGTDPMTAMKMLLEKMQKYPSNEAFLKSF